MSKLIFSIKDIETLKSNPNVVRVSDKSITYSDDFKRHFIEEYLSGTMQCPEGHLAMRCDIRKGNYDNQYYTYCLNMKICKKC